jgi:HD-GYP domain-containing protein (c-di-GMP phosphodiesterase class II)
MLKKDSHRPGSPGHAPACKLEGAWLSHPFWKTRFVLDDPADLDRLHDSGVRDVWIDAALGLDVARATTEPAPLPALRSPVAAPSPAPWRLTGRPVVRHAAMARRARRRPPSASQGRGEVVKMFAEARLGKAVDAELPAAGGRHRRSVFRNPGALVSLARLKTADDYTYMHSVAVCALMVALGRRWAWTRPSAARPAWPACCTTWARR